MGAKNNESNFAVCLDREEKGVGEIVVLAADSLSRVFSRRCIGLCCTTTDVGHTSQINHSSRLTSYFPVSRRLLLTFDLKQSLRMSVNQRIEQERKMSLSRSSLTFFVVLCVVVLGFLETQEKEIPRVTLSA